MTERSDIERMIPGLRRYARALVEREAGPEVGDELVQHTLLLALQGDRTVRTKTLRIWLYATLTKLNRDRLRSLNCRDPRPQAADSSRREINGINHMPAPKQSLAHALDALPLEGREALLLVVLEGMSYAQVAETLAIPTNAVLARLSVARESLGTCLEPRPYLRSGRERRSGHLRVVT